MKELFTRSRQKTRMELKWAWTDTGESFFQLVIIFLLFNFSGKVVIIVNTASQCGFTNSNYSQLKELLDKYKSEGLEVAAFPCNQFGKQVSFHSILILIVTSDHHFLNLGARL